jgi:hypothetical protein
MELKEFENRQDLIGVYNFSEKQESEEVGHRWFLLPLEVQMMNFVNGLGRISYFAIEYRDLDHNPYSNDEPEDLRKPYYKTIKTDFILVKDLVHDHSCKCAKCNHTSAEMIKLEGYEDCYIGCVNSYAEYPAVGYDHSKIIQKLMNFIIKLAIYRKNGT